MDTCQLQEGFDPNPPEWQSTPEEEEEQWKFIAKMTLAIRDIMLGNPKLAEMGYEEEALGRNAIFGGFQGQRMWTDFSRTPTLQRQSSTTGFDWNGKRPPFILATENDNGNALSMLMLHLTTNLSAVFADVRTYWSPEAVKRVTGYDLTGRAAGGFIHLINSGAAALDGTGCAKDEQGNNVMKPWWKLTDDDISAMLDATAGACKQGLFRGGGFSSQFSTKGAKCRW